MQTLTGDSGYCIDVHVHIVGNGSDGSGCWLKPTRRHALQARLMTWLVGMPQSALRGNLDRLYVEHLLKLVRESSLTHAVILAQDYVYDDRDQRRPDLGAFYVPNDYVLALAKEHPEFLPGVSIHPARPDALDELERCLEGGAVLMKCLPNCHNINCSDRRHERFWRRMAEAGLPLLAHTGGELTLPVNNPAYADPATLALPLELGVTVIAAHLASNSTFLDPNYFPRFVEMAARYPNLYGDNSALTTPVRSKFLRAGLDPEVAERIVHGSDFPVPIQACWPLLRRQLCRDDYRRCAACNNLLERDILIKRSLGYRDEVFSRAATLLRLPAGAGRGDGSSGNSQTAAPDCSETDTSR